MPFYIKNTIEDLVRDPFYWVYDRIGNITKTTWVLSSLWMFICLNGSAGIHIAFRGYIEFLMTPFVFAFFYFVPVSIALSRCKRGIRTALGTALSLVWIWYMVRHAGAEVALIGLLSMLTILVRRWNTIRLVLAFLALLSIGGRSSSSVSNGSPVDTDQINREHQERMEDEHWDRMFNKD